MYIFANIDRLYCRIDKGKENLGVVYYMLYHRGTKSVSAGRSVHNTRIERMWVDVRKRCTEVFRRRFMCFDAILTRTIIFKVLKDFFSCY